MKGESSFQAEKTEAEVGQPAMKLARGGGGPSQDLTALLGFLCLGTAGKQGQPESGDGWGFLKWKMVTGTA